MEQSYTTSVQIGKGLQILLFRKNFIHFMAVSYTHLDGYKRQVYRNICHPIEIKAIYLMIVCMKNSIWMLIYPQILHQKMQRQHKKLSKKP